ncbi:(p)ppGpp synthetase [Agrobacterium vitis]|nr:(p)ppGpp synthetase [Allorhizobium ampelinum]
MRERCSFSLGKALIRRQALELTEQLIAIFASKRHAIDRFRQTVQLHFEDNPDLFNNGRAIVHSTKSRLKDENHLREKISRKLAEGRTINEENFFSEITDLAGVRVLLLYQEDFAIINRAIRDKIENQGDWIFAEEPIVYTWDPENTAYFESLGLKPKLKSSSYTSVHYLVRPHDKSPVHCEIQVRTLFEEIWGEVDHHLNYPSPTDNSALSEQIKVLSKIVGAGSRLLDSINRVKSLEESL